MLTDDDDALVEFFRTQVINQVLDEETLACVEVLVKERPFAWARAVGKIPATADATGWQDFLRVRGGPDPIEEISARHAPRHIERPEPGEDA